MGSFQLVLMESLSGYKYLCRFNTWMCLQPLGGEDLLVFVDIPDVV